MSEAVTEVHGHNVDATAPAAEVIGQGVVPTQPASEAPVQADAGSAGTDGGQSSGPTGEDTPAAPPAQESVGDGGGGEDGGYDLGEITNPAVLGVANLFKDAGVPASDALGLFAKAMESGNFNDVDADGIKKSLGDTVGAMVVSVMKGVFHENQVQQAAVREKFMNVVGGEDAWRHIDGWIKAEEVKDPAFKVQIQSYRELAAKDEASALLVASALKSMYKDANITRKPSAFVTGDPRAASIGVSPILDSKDFGRIYHKAMEAGDTAGMETALARWRAGGGRKK